MAVDFEEYQLRCQLRGHTSEVLGICVCGNADIATSSRDRTVRLWSLDSSDDRLYKPAKTLLGHESFVGPMVWIEPDDEYPEGRVVSGGMDTMVFVWDLKTGEKVQTLKGHQFQVTGLAFDNGDIVSSSADNTLKRWRNGQPVESWEAHKAAIQAVIRLPSGELVTGSSDTTLKLWRGTTCTHTFIGHTDMVRGLAMMSGLGVLSASNDRSIRLWALDGEVLMEMFGHTSIVHSVDSHVSGLIISSSEDCFAKIWKDGVCVQSIEHPDCVWDAKFLENGDIVTACSDGVVRIWTINQDKIADDLELQSYFSLLTQQKISRKREAGVKLEDLPGLEALRIPGTIAGEKKIVREGNNGVAYAWDIKEQKWDKIRRVDSLDDGMKCSVLDGSAYVPHADIGDGERKQKLPRLDNPYESADMKGSTLDPSFCDPYTLSSANVPGQSSNKSGAAKPSYEHICKAAEMIVGTASCHQSTSSSAGQVGAQSQYHLRSSSTPLNRRELGQPSANQALEREVDQRGSDHEESTSESTSGSEDYSKDPLYDLDTEVVKSGHKLGIPGILSYDLSDKAELIPIRVKNSVDSTTLPIDFQYVKKMKVADNIIQQEDYIGCKCRPKCVEMSCPCIQLNGSLPYENGRLTVSKDIVFECSKKCSCGPNCVLRTSQAEFKYPLELYRTVNKGWAVRTLSTIPTGAPVCEYLGWLKRLEDLDDGATKTNFYIHDIDCLQILKERGTTSNDIPGLESVKMDQVSSDPEYTIDAAQCGNIARFINHSCQPNLNTQCVTHNDQDVTEAIKQARVVFFTDRIIKSLEELTIFYGYKIDNLVNEEGNIEEVTCHCGAPNCRKRLI